MAADGLSGSQPRQAADLGDHLRQARAGPERAQPHRPRAPPRGRIARHWGRVAAHGPRNVGLVDGRKVRAGDPRPALARDVVAYPGVYLLDGQSGQFGLKVADRLSPPDWMKIAACARASPAGNGRPPLAPHKLPLWQIWADPGPPGCFGKGSEGWGLLQWLRQRLRRAGSLGAWRACPRTPRHPQRGAGGPSGKALPLQASDPPECAPGSPRCRRRLRCPRPTAHRVRTALAPRRGRNGGRVPAPRRLHGATRPSRRPRHPHPSSRVPLSANRKQCADRQAANLGLNGREKELS